MVWANILHTLAVQVLKHSMFCCGLPCSGSWRLSVEPYTEFWQSKVSYTFLSSCARGLHVLVAISAGLIAKQCKKLLLLRRYSGFQESSLSAWRMLTSKSYG